MSQEIEIKLAVHEAVCAERYERIQEMFESGKQRMSRIEYILYGLIAATLLGPGALAEVIKKLTGL